MGSPKMWNILRTDSDRVKRTIIVLLTIYVDYFSCQIGWGLWHTLQTFRCSNVSVVISSVAVNQMKNVYGPLGVIVNQICIIRKRLDIEWNWRKFGSSVRNLVYIRSSGAFPILALLDYISRAYTIACLDGCALSVVVCKMFFSLRPTS